VASVETHGDGLDSEPEEKKLVEREAERGSPTGRQVEAEEAESAPAVATPDQQDQPKEEEPPLDMKQQEGELRRFGVTQ